MNQLRHDRDEQTKELTEAQEFRARLLKVMGTAGQNQMTSNQPNTRTSSSNVYIQSIQGLNGESQDGGAEIDPTRSFESSTSSRSGPTPKRNKRRQSLNSPLTNPTRTVRGASRGKSLGNTVLRSRNKPLKDLSLNTNTADLWRPTESQCQKSQAQYAGSPRTGSKENDIQELEEEIGDTSFGSDVFTSTNEQQVNDTGGRISRDIYDETTVDF